MLRIYTIKGLALLKAITKLLSSTLQKDHNLFSISTLLGDLQNPIKTTWLKDLIPSSLVKFI